MCVYIYITMYNICRYSASFSEEPEALVYKAALGIESFSLCEKRFYCCAFCIEGILCCECCFGRVRNALSDRKGLSRILKMLRV